MSLGQPLWKERKTTSIYFICGAKVDMTYQVLSTLFPPPLSMHPTSSTSYSGPRLHTMTTKLVALSPDQQRAMSSLPVTSPSFLKYLLEYQNETIRGFYIRLPGNYVHYSLLLEQPIVPGETTVGDLKTGVLNIIYLTDGQERVDECVLCQLGVHVDGMHEVPSRSSSSSSARVHIPQAV